MYLLFISVFFAIYYGSWEFTDKLTLHLNTLGISYVRYWLPIYLLSLPFVATGILWFIRFFPKELEMPTSILVWKDKVAIFITTKENPITIVIESQAAADSHRKYFNILWEHANK